MNKKIWGLAASVFLLAALAFGTWTASRAQDKTKGQWAATGTLLEACTCAVPCTCNFGEGPSPNHFCHAVYAYKLDKAHYDGTDLTGLIIGGADGPNGSSGFLDEQATPAQRLALQKLAARIFAAGGPSTAPRKFAPAKITHEASPQTLRLALGKSGGFTARPIIGRDGKTPVVVENNTIWPIPRATKAKTTTFSFRDTGAGSVSGDGTNANYGQFTLSGSL